MSQTVSFDLEDDIAFLQLDDGKANAISPSLLAALGEALDRAEKEAKAVVLCGRPGRFSAGFDLSVLGQGGTAGRDLVAGGAELGLRLCEFPRPVVAACTGHAIAMGAVLLMCCDARIGARGAFKIGLNEVAIGMALPHFARELARERLSKRHLHRAVVHAELYDAEGAVDAGFLDVSVESEAVLATARSRAQQLAQLDPRAFAVTKRALTAASLAEVRNQLDSDLARLLPKA